jgi:solute carrier family 25 protein 34/35
MAFYKGFSTHFMRIGPHFTLTFVFLGMLKRQLIEGQPASVRLSNLLHSKDEIPTTISPSSPSPSTPSLAIVRQEQI